MNAGKEWRESWIIYVPLDQDNNTDILSQVQKCHPRILHR